MRCEYQPGVPFTVNPKKKIWAFHFFVVSLPVKNHGIEVSRKGLGRVDSRRLTETA